MRELCVMVLRKSDDGECLVDVKTFVILNVFKAAQPCNLQLVVKYVNEWLQAVVSIDLSEFEPLVSCKEAELCVWPLILLDNHVVSGLCSVARHICKLSDKAEVHKLLGFREACLVACAESSVWTRFCEIELIQTTNQLLQGTFTTDNHSFTLPVDIVKYEHHLAQPVKIHNLYKIARNNHNDRALKSSTPREDLNVPHDYAEGPSITLADLILFPCLRIFFKYYNGIKALNQIPLVTSWFERLQKSGLNGVEFNLPYHYASLPFSAVVVPEVPKASLYKADATKALPVKHTKQNKIDEALNLIAPLKEKIVNGNLPFGFTKEFSWDEIPLIANPQGGALPAKRADRKCEQLENLLKATLELVRDRSYTIVDFCSGSGHLGILVALLLPNCHIILVENKERSLCRATATITRLNLTNITIVQSNLDYFKGDFDLGIALHACGVATDLVIQMCIKTRAHFICCPCCYGGVKNCHELTYPRSKKFQEVFEGADGQYFNLAHAADQTHDQANTKTAQGYFCMDVIDSDRKSYAEEWGYEVHLGKLQPVSCTNKNNLLVGICKQKKNVEFVK